MGRSIWLALGCAMMLGCMQVSGDPGSGAAREESAMGNNAFALDLYRQLRDEDGNLFLSPYSVRTALAMTYAGARGDTAEQMRAALRFGPDDAATQVALADSMRRLRAAEGDGIELNVANRLWGEQTHGFLPSFVELNRYVYGGALESADFRHAAETVRLRINAWVEQTTRDRIRGLIPPGGVGSDTRLALVNAVYFNGLWAEPFDAARTRDAPFHLRDGSTVPVPLMTFTEVPRLPFLAADGARIVELDYQGHDLSMVVLLPDSDVGLSELESRLDETVLAGWVDRLRPQPVQVHLPRFNLTWGARNLVPPLSGLGIRDAFVDGRADFSGIDGSRDLLISGVFHKAFVEVDERGTEAAAATGVVVGVTSLPPPPEVFRADRPFLFLIREKATGDILFLGRLERPVP